MIAKNRTEITGNLVADPETHQVGESTVTRARIIHTDRYKDRETQEWKDSEPMALDVEIWNAYGTSFAEKVKKGFAVLLEGALKPNNYEKGGVNYYGYRLRVDSWQIVAKPGTRTAAKKQARTRRDTTTTAANG